MAKRSGAAHVVTTSRTYKGKTYKAHLLRRSYREDGKVKNETLGNLSHLPEHVVELIRRSLRGEEFVEVNELFDIESVATPKPWVGPSVARVGADRGDSWNRGMARFEAPGSRRADVEAASGNPGNRFSYGQHRTASFHRIASAFPGAGIWDAKGESGRPGQAFAPGFRTVGRGVGGFFAAAGSGGGGGGSGDDPEFRPPGHCCRTCKLVVDKNPIAG